MQPNLDASLASRTIAFPAPGADTFVFPKARPAVVVRKGVTGVSVGEWMAWLALALSAAATLLCSFWI